MPSSLKNHGAVSRYQKQINRNLVMRSNQRMVPGDWPLPACIKVAPAIVFISYLFTPDTYETQSQKGRI
jgi:hypothetical protein